MFSKNATALGIVVLATIFPMAGFAQDILAVRAGKVAIGDAALLPVPGGLLHVKGSDGATRLLVQEASGQFAERVLMSLSNNGPARFSISDSSSGAAWSFKTAGPGLSAFDISKDGSGVAELRIDANTGNLTIQGDIITANCPSG